MNVLKALTKPVVIGVLLGLLLLFDHHHVRLVLAASGGRMGGSSFSSRSSSICARSSRSLSSTSYGTRRINSQAYYSSGSYSTQTRCSCYPKSSYQTGPCDMIDIRISMTLVITIIIVVIGFLLYRYGADVDIVETSVFKLQVGLLGTARSLQKDLNAIAETANTSTPQGFNYLLQEAILALLRHPDYYISGYFYVDVKIDVKEGEKRFNQLSVEERGKFDEESLVNVNHIRRQTATKLESIGECSEYIVVTIIVAASGIHELPPIKSSEQLKKALEKLASIPSSNIIAVEVLWTPQKENDSLTKKEYLKDYPLLHPL